MKGVGVERHQHLGAGRADDARSAALPPFS
jgi:hypothetical protein